jgi:hypothetical protein
MKLIITKFVLILGFVSANLAAPQFNQSPSSNEAFWDSSEMIRFTPATRMSLKLWFEEFKDVYGDLTEVNTITKIIRNADKNCVQEKLNMTENGNKTINYAQALTSIGIGYLKCYDKTAISELFNEFFEDDEDIHFAVYGECYFRALKELEPTSKLVENFNEDQMEVTKEECDDNLKKDSFDEWIKDIEEYSGDLSTFSCGNLNGDDIRMLLVKSAILSHEINEELKESEVDKLKHLVGYKLNKIFDCVMKNL